MPLKVKTVASTLRKAAGTHYQAHNIHNVHIRQSYKGCLKGKDSVL